MAAYLFSIMILNFLLTPLCPVWGVGEKENWFGTVNGNAYICQQTLCLFHLNCLFQTVWLTWGWSFRFLPSTLLLLEMALSSHVPVCVWACVLSGPWWVPAVLHLGQPRFWVHRSGNYVLTHGSFSLQVLSVIPLKHVATFGSGMGTPWPSGQTLLL